MARGRFVPREIATDLAMNSVSIEAEYLFLRLLPHLDVEGRVEGDPRQVRAIAVPMREELSIERVESALTELDAAGIIQRYEVDGRLCVSYLRFADTQTGLRKDREAASTIPGPSLRTYSGATPDSAGPTRVKGSEGKESEGEGEGFDGVGGVQNTREKPVCVEDGCSRNADEPGGRCITCEIHSHRANGGRP